MKPCYLNRRTLLRGAGVSLALPWLEIMGTKARAAGSEAPRRMACIFFPNGVSLPAPDHPDHQEWHWFPHGKGREFEFTRTLESLEPLRDNLSVLAGLSHPGGRSFAGHSVSGSFLTGAEVTRDSSSNSISIDQYYAEKASEQTRLHSLILSVSGGVGPGSRTHTLSFTKEGQPIYAEEKLRRAFTRMFGNDAKSDQAARQALARQKSLLDSLLDDAKNVNRKLGKADQEKLEEYLSSVREVERRVERTERWLDIPKPSVDPESLFLDATREQPLEYIRAMYDLIFLAFQTDTTRAATCLLGSEGGGDLANNFPTAIGLANHHGLSHSNNKTPNGFKNWALYDQFLAEQLAYFLKRLKDTPEADSNLLDRSLVFYGCSTSTTHRAKNYPLILAGGREFGLKHGQFHQFDEEKNRLSNLFVTMLNALGTDTERFADSTGSVDTALLANIIQIMNHFQIILAFIAIATPGFGDDQTFDSVVQPFLKDYCIKCHGPEEQKGDRRYDTIQPDFANVESTILWHDILDQLLLEEMPPKDPMPTSENREQVIAWLTKKFEEQRAAARVSENGTVMRRLSHAEYTNTLEDLFQLEIPEFSRYRTLLTPDNVVHGFDTDAKQLKMSQGHFQTCYEIAGLFVDRVLPYPKPELTSEVHLGNTFNRTRFTTWDMLDKKATHIDFTSKSGRKSRSGPPWKAPVDGLYKFRINAGMMNRDLNRGKHRTPGPGEPWLLRVFTCSSKYGRTDKDNPSDRNLVTLTMTEEGPNDYELEAYLEEGYTIKMYWLNGGTGAKNRREYPKGYDGASLRVHEMTVAGPYFDQWPPRPIGRIFGENPPEHPGPEYASGVLRGFAQRAWLRPVDEDEMAPFNRLAGQTLEDEGYRAIAKAMRAILCTESFLYHNQKEEDGRLDNYALASRLSYFLWKTSPDFELLQAAHAGELATLEGYQSQVRRMLDDPRLERFLDDFIHQWLGFENINRMAPDDTKFEVFYRNNIKRYAIEETRLFVKHLIKENLSIYNCLDSDFAMLNENMALLYGIKGVKGSEFRKVSLPEDSPRGGLITQASVLTATSNGVDTSPIVRGVWMLENILGIEPTPPPADVEPIDPDTRGARTIKEQLTAHREKETCNNCHRTFDYLGLSLENFDPIGRWRTKYDKETAVDATTESPAGEQIEDIRELQEYLLEKRKRFFATGLTEKLLAYGVGREMSYQEKGEIEEIYKRTNRSDGFRDLLEYVVTSRIFISR